MQTLYVTTRTIVLTSSNMVMAVELRVTMYPICCISKPLLEILNHLTIQLKLPLGEHQTNCLSFMFHEFFS